MRRHLLSFTVSLLALSSAAEAAQNTWPYWYLGLAGGFTVRHDSDWNSGTTPPRDVVYNDGYSASVSLGYMPQQLPMRFEGELSFFQNDIDRLTQQGGIGLTSLGEARTTAYMFNTYYDLPLGWKLQPYIGAGIGMTDVDMEVGGNAGSAQTFAYQFMGGVSYAPEMLPLTELTAGYRFLTGNDVEVGFGDISQDIHSAQAGMRFRF